MNKLKTSRAWDEASKFDAEKDKAQFRLYEDACDRVKTFYKEQHGEASRYAGLAPDVELTPRAMACREADCRIQHPGSGKLQEDRPGADGCVPPRRSSAMVLITATAGIWEAMEMLNTLVDDSDPDVRRQSAEPCRDGVMLTFIADECISD